MPHDINVTIWNLGTDESSDITGVALVKRASVRHNGPRSFTVEVPAGADEVTTLFGDGYPAMQKGDRKLVVTRDDTPIFHGRIFNVERVGDGTRNRATITAFDPLMELGYEADDRAGRPVRDGTGNFINPSFSSPINGADLISQILTVSQQTGSESDPDPGEGPLPIDLTTGSFTATEDMSPENTMSWPVMIGDFLQQLVDTNLVDIYMRPLDPGEGFDYEMAALSVVDEWGTDRSATVHFDYWTGSKNAKAARHVEDFSTVCNKLYDYLGPRISATRWGGNITPGSPGTTADPSASRARYGGPGPDYGTFMQIRVYDAADAENDTRPLYVKLWDAEQRLRMEPRDMLFLTPAPDYQALYEPWDHYDVGDLITVNVGGDFGVNLAAVQRVYGFDVEWDRDGVERVTELIVTADPS